MLWWRTAAAPWSRRSMNQKIKGVVVVCAGGGAPKVVAQVTAAVKTALDISSAKITVSKTQPRRRRSLID